MNSQISKNNIILIDAECLLCHSFAKFIISQDKNQVFKFAALQDEILKNILELKWLDYPESDSVLVFNGSQLLQKSRAALYALTQLPRYRQWTRLWYIIPKPVSDKVYDFVARNRKKRFGEDKNCDLATTKKIKERLV